MGGVPQVTSPNKRKPFENVLSDNQMKLIEELSRLQENLHLQNESINMQNQMTTIEKNIHQIIDEFDKYDGEEIEVVPQLLKQLIEYYRHLHQILQNKNFVINELISKCENEKQYLSKETLEPLSQTLFGFLLGLQALEKEAVSSEVKSYITNLKVQVGNQIHQLQNTNEQVYPSTIKDLGVIGTLKSLYESSLVANKITTDVKFNGTVKNYNGTVELLIVRFVHQFIELIDKHTTNAQVEANFKEINKQLEISFLCNKKFDLEALSEYKIFQEKADSLSFQYSLEILEDGFRYVLLIPKD